MLNIHSCTISSFYAEIFYSVKLTIEELLFCCKWFEEEGRIDHEQKDPGTSGSALMAN